MINLRAGGVFRKVQSQRTAASQQVSKPLTKQDPVDNFPAKKSFEDRVLLINQFSGWLEPRLQTPSDFLASF